jgi:hypothetical protein
MDDIWYATAVCASYTDFLRYVVYIVLCLVLNISLSERYQIWYLITNFGLRTPCVEFVHIYRVLPSRGSSLAAQVNGALKSETLRAVQRRCVCGSKGKLSTI